MKKMVSSGTRTNRIWYWLHFFGHIGLLRFGFLVLSRALLFMFITFFTQIPGGILAQKYGTKTVFGLSNLGGCLVCSLIPLAAYFSFNMVLFLRLLQGLICGFAWPGSFKNF
jgi:MFS family permease